MAAQLAATNSVYMITESTWFNVLDSVVFTHSQMCETKYGRHFAMSPCYVSRFGCF